MIKDIEDSLHLGELAIDQDFLQSLDKYIEAHFTTFQASGRSMSPWPVEDLIHEAGRLVENAIALNSRKLDLEIEAVNEHLELSRREQHSKIIGTQISHGMLEVEYIITSSERDKLRKEVVNDKVILENSQKNERAMSEDSDFQLKTRRYRSDLAQTMAAQDPGAARDLTNQIAIMEQELNSLKAKIGTISAENVFNSSTARLDATTRTAKILYEVSKGELEKKGVDDALNTVRRTLLSTDGFGLNYRQRIQDIKKLFYSDMVEIFIRVSAIETGLKTVFGLEMAAPAIESTSYLSDTSVWLREVVRVLSAIYDFDFPQEVSFALSAGKAHPDGSIDVKIEKDLFGNFDLVRLSAIGVKQINTMSNESIAVDFEFDSASDGDISGRLTRLPQRVDHNADFLIDGRMIRNRSPFGIWKFRASAGTKSITDLLFCIRVITNSRAKSDDPS